MNSVVNIQHMTIHIGSSLSSFVQCVIVYVIALKCSREVSDIAIFFKFCTFLRLFVLKLFCSNICALIVSFGYIMQ